MRWDGSFVAKKKYFGLGLAVLFSCGCGDNIIVVHAKFSGCLLLCPDLYFLAMNVVQFLLLREFYALK